MDFKQVEVDNLATKDKWICGEYMIHKQPWSFSKDGGAQKGVNYVITCSCTRIHKIYEIIYTLEAAIKMAELHLKRKIENEN